MAEDSQARSPSLPMASETTPLLSDPPVESSNEEGRHNEEPEVASFESLPHISRALRLLTALSLFFSIGAIALCLAIFPMENHGPLGYWQRWDVVMASQSVLGIVSLLSILTFVQFVHDMFNALVRRCSHCFVDRFHTPTCEPDHNAPMVVPDLGCCHHAIRHNRQRSRIRRQFQ